MQTVNNNSNETQLEQYKTLIGSFYAAFEKQDYETMAACYHPEVYFKDAAFEVSGKQACAMWHMLCSRSKGLQLEYSVSAQNGKISAHWEPIYTFSQTGRRVHNIVDAQFELKDGKIIRHIDTFDFWRWSKQALGFTGLLLGWSGFLQRKVNAMAAQSLAAFIAQNPKYQ